MYLECNKQVPWWFTHRPEEPPQDQVQRHQEPQDEVLPDRRHESQDGAIGVPEHGHLVVGEDELHEGPPHDELGKAAHWGPKAVL